MSFNNTEYPSKAYYYSIGGLLGNFGLIEYLVRRTLKRTHNFLGAFRGKKSFTLKPCAIGLII